MQWVHRNSSLNASRGVTVGFDGKMGGRLREEVEFGEAEFGPGTAGVLGLRPDGWTKGPGLDQGYWKCFW